MKALLKIASSSDEPLWLARKRARQQDYFNQVRLNKSRKRNISPYPTPKAGGGIMSRMYKAVEGVFPKA